MYHLSQMSSCTSSVPEVKLYNQLTSSVPEVNLYTICPRGQAAHQLCWGSSCTSTVLGVNCPRGQAVYKPSWRSSCRSTVAEVKLQIDSPRPPFPLVGKSQQRWWRAPCSRLSANWLYSRNKIQECHVSLITAYTLSPTAQLVELAPFLQVLLWMQNNMMPPSPPPTGTTTHECPRLPSLA